MSDSKRISSPNASSIASKIAMSLSTSIEYGGQELVAMANARNYYRWILSCCRPHIGSNVLEHGAGIGTFSTFLLAESIERLVALEPASNLLPTLRRRLEPWGKRVEVVPSTIENIASQLRNSAIDTVISVNVLEHILDDRRTLAAMWEVLSGGGHLVVFVPALPWLYGSLDHAVEHVRRYRRQELREKVSAAGFQIVWDRYMNLPGVVSWLMAGRILRRATLSPAQITLYDRCVIPIVAWLERLCPPPIGQNLLLIARK